MHSRLARTRLCSVFVTLVLTAAGCASGSGRETIATSAVQPAAAVATTAPVAMPTATAAPIDVAPLAATPDSEPALGAEVSAATPAPAPTEPPATAALVAQPTTPPAEPESGAVTLPTAVVQPTAAPQPTLEPTVTPIPEPAGAPIFLGDFEVVNLGTGATQQIAELAPRGATMLWFWAPH